MTTITTDQLIPSTRSHRSLRNTVGGFVAGVVLAGAAFFGVNAVTDNGSATPAPASAATTHGPGSQSSNHCPVVRGVC
jgi:hypothetical protein